LPELLPGQRLRDGRRPVGATGEADPPESFQLRALQDLRHHGPISDHHLGAARRRRRAELRWDVGVSRSLRLQFRHNRGMITAPPGSSSMKRLFVACFALLLLTSAFSVAQSRARTCDTGRGWFKMPLWDGYEVQLIPDAPGKCRTVLRSVSGEEPYVVI